MVEHAEHETDWVSAHVFFQDDLDLLLTDVVAPLAAELAERRMSAELFFLRYWDGGRHLRVRVLPAAGVTHADVRHLVLERFCRHLAQHPSDDRMSTAQYAALAPRLARQEGMRSWVTEPYPNNSVQFLPYRREHRRYGCGASIQAVEAHFAESSRIALRVLALRPSAERRATLALACLLVAVLCDPQGLSGEGMWRFTGGRTDADLSGVIELARQARRTVEAGTGAGPHGDSALTRWARSISDLRLRLTAEAAAGGDVGVGPGPVLDLCAHLICNRLGVSTVTEAALRRMAAQALDSIAAEGN